MMSMLADTVLSDNIIDPEACDGLAGGRGSRRDSYVRVRERVYSLRGIFVIQVNYLEGGEVFASHRCLPVHGHGPSLELALRAFCQAFDFQWRNLVDVAEDQLTPGGIKRRRAMLESVEKVRDTSIAPSSTSCDATFPGA